MKGLMLAASHSGSGKTLLTMIILRGLKQRGVTIAPFKAGPDYIDPILHQMACHETSFNLDIWAMRPELIQNLTSTAQANNKILEQFLKSGNRFSDKNCGENKELEHSVEPSKTKNTLIVEAMMGLFDGALDGSSTPADLAHFLNLNIVLIVDCRKMSHSIAALVSGFHHFSHKTKISGLILNQVGSENHEKMLRQALLPLNIPIIGAIRRNEKLNMPQRHLGLSLPEERQNFESFIAQASQLIGPQLDWQQLINLAHSNEITKAACSAINCLPPLGQHIAIAHDNAFCFTYPHLLESWQKLGCELSFFSPLNNDSPPIQADSIYLPGGYPELYAELLSHNNQFREGMKKAAINNKLIYGECGGFMVLGEMLEDKKGKTYPMLGLLPLKTSIKTPRLHLGYRQIKNISLFPLPQQMRGHEFHYSSIIYQGKTEPLFQTSDALGQNLATCGLVCGRVAGSFIHLIDKIST